MACDSARHHRKRGYPTRTGTSGLSVSAAIRTGLWHALLGYEVRSSGRSLQLRRLRLGDRRIRCGARLKAPAKRGPGTDKTAGISRGRLSSTLHKYLALASTTTPVIPTSFLQLLSSRNASSPDPYASAEPKPTSFWLNTAEGSLRHAVRVTLFRLPVGQETRPGGGRRIAGREGGGPTSGCFGVGT